MNKKTIGLVFGLVVGVAALIWAYPYPNIHWTGYGEGSNRTAGFRIQTPSAGSVPVFVPTANNTFALGTTALRFSNVFTTLMNVSGAITASGGIVASNPFRLPTVDVAVTSPTANVGDMVVTSAGTVYVSTNSAALITSWMKVGTQT